MKFTSTFLLVLFCVIVENASAYNVTFRLDMTGVSGYTTPEVNGTFNGWCGSCNPMNDSNGDGIWEAVISLPQGYFEYKFSADNWSQQETLPVGASCTATTGQFTNRTLNVSANTVLPVVCWGSCTSCTNYQVTFQVSMASVSGFTTPYVSGNFNGWCGNCLPMSDADGDQIWTATTTLLPGLYEYKFSYDNWVGAENLVPGSSCTMTTGSFTNRFINVSQTQTLPVVCWGSCDSPGTSSGPQPSIQIALTSGTNPSCEGTALIFTATASNVSSAPVYQWQVNGVNVGTNSATLTSLALQNGDQVSCRLNGGAGCSTNSPVVSNTIQVIREAPITPSVAITASTSNPLCQGATVTFTAQATNGGANPSYQWKVNGQNVGTNSSTYTTANLTSGQVVTCQLTSSAACVSSPWNLTWSDEFNGTSLDPTKWTPEIGASGWGNNEWQYYTGTPNNVQFSDGQLHIVARNDGPPGQQYSSARLITKNKFSFKYGRVTGRLQLPLGQGIWPAFWMLGANIDQVSWPSCGEIDIMEHINNETKIYGTTHWSNGGWTYNTGNIVTPVTGFHEYTVEWD
ncbi:MAG: family 16 glycosylhydrolase, partial [Flavobacteriales bacterium]